MIQPLAACQVVSWARASVRPSAGLLRCACFPAGGNASSAPPPETGPGWDTRPLGLLTAVGDAVRGALTAAPDDWASMRLQGLGAQGGGGGGGVNVTGAGGAAPPEALVEVWRGLAAQALRAVEARVRPLQAALTLREDGGGGGEDAAAAMTEGDKGGVSVLGPVGWLARRAGGGVLGGGAAGLAPLLGGGLGSAFGVVGAGGGVNGSTEERGVLVFARAAGLAGRRLRAAQEGMRRAADQQARGRGCCTALVLLLRAASTPTRRLAN